MVFALHTMDSDTKTTVFVAQKMFFVSETIFFISETMFSADH
jgi:hypothetical protein